MIGTEPGVTVVICSHNGARLLPRTLDHLKAQRVPHDIPWEVVLVDNASSDDTAKVAQSCWGDYAAAPLRVVNEPRLGAGNARTTGFDAARYELVSSVDDDNWVANDWVIQVARVMSEHPEAGACGGVSKAAFEMSPPAWFERYENFYAVGPRATSGLYADMLWGAGLSFRRTIWQRLRSMNFKPLVAAFGEDHELALILRLCGWKLWLDPRLRFEHFMPAWRLNWNYLLHLQHIRNADLARIDPYYIILDSRTKQHGVRRARWIFSLAHVVRCLAQNLVLRPHKVIWGSRFEGDEDGFRIACYLGRLRGLLLNRTRYGSDLRLVANTDWRALAGP
ncbi:MAG TPA: glycosyltransferase [Candidatus Binataceae bacterium]|nr:glycosyltransferase [Candidatus Binataceae bacterium]